MARLGVWLRLSPGRASLDRFRISSAGRALCCPNAIRYNWANCQPGDVFRHRGSGIRVHTSPSDRHLAADLCSRVDHNGCRMATRAYSDRIPLEHSGLCTDNAVAAHAMGRNFWHLRTDCDHSHITCDTIGRVGGATGAILVNYCGSVDRAARIGDPLRNVAVGQPSNNVSAKRSTAPCAAVFQPKREV